VSRNYRRGRAYEYRVIRMLEQTGYSAGRSAGSHGLFDVWAVNAQHIRVIQVKCGSASMSPAEREQFRELPAPANVSKEIWAFSGKRGQPPRIAML
jgi:Holliday junction resolvase